MPQPLQRVERPSHAHCKRDAEFLGVPGKPELLLRRPHRDEEQIGLRLADGDAHARRIVVAEVARVRAGDDESRIPHFETLDRLTQRLGRGPEEKDSVPAHRGLREKSFHEVDPGHTLPHRIAEQSRPPDDRLAVGGDQVGASYGLAKLRVRLHGHGLRRIECCVSSPATHLDRLETPRDRLLHVDAVERAAKEGRPAAHRAPPSSRAA